LKAGQPKTDLLGELGTVCSLAAQGLALTGPGDRRPVRRDLLSGRRKLVEPGDAGFGIEHVRFVVGPLPRQVTLAAVGIAPATLALNAALVERHHSRIPGDLGHVIKGHIVRVGKETTVTKAHLRGNRRRWQHRRGEQNVAEPLRRQIRAGPLQRTEQHLKVRHGEQGGSTAGRVDAEVPLV